MSQKEINQVAIFEKLTQKTMTQKQASQLLNLSVRQVKRKLKAYRRLGALSLVHQLRGKPGNHHLPVEVKDQAIVLVGQHYPDFAPTFASEKLLEQHQLVINHETLRLLMIENDLWQPWQQRVKHRSWRERKASLGELVQLDGSDHDWFEGRAPRCTLIAFIDDATSQIMYLEFTSGETTLNLMRSTRTYLNLYGKPYELYTDRGGVYKVNIHNQEKDKQTQYARALAELNIKLTFARSPQAKGRIERLFGTLQDRLVKELRLQGTASLNEANVFANQVYLPEHNRKYAVEPRKVENLHSPLMEENLERIFTIRESRQLQNDFTLAYQGQLYQLERKQQTLVFPRNVITVETDCNEHVRLYLRRTELNYHLITNHPEKQTKPVIFRSQTPWVPAVDHPWRQYQQKVTFLNC